VQPLIERLCFPSSSSAVRASREYFFPTLVRAASHKRALIGFKFQFFFKRKINPTGLLASTVQLAARMHMQGEGGRAHVDGVATKSLDVDAVTPHDGSIEAVVMPHLAISQSSNHGTFTSLIRTVQVRRRSVGLPF